MRDSVKLCGWHRHVRARRAWDKLGRPVTCREMVVAVFVACGDVETTRTRVAALGRWERRTINEVLRMCLPGATSPRVRLKAAPEKRPVFKKLRRCGIGAGEALRELGL